MTESIEVHYIIPAVWLGGRPYKTYVSVAPLVFDWDWRDEKYAHCVLPATVTVDDFPSGKPLVLDIPLSFAELKQVEDGVLEVEIPPVVVNPLDAAVRA